MIGIFEHETEVIARLEMVHRETRDVHRRIEHARTQADRRALNRQLEDLKKQSDYLVALLKRAR